MFKQAQYALIAAIAFSFVGGASLAEAGKIRSTVERRHSPEKGFWDSSHHSKNVVRHHASPRVHYTPKTHESNSGKSWGWQRSSRAELHHPGPRKTRGSSNTSNPGALFNLFR
ncbi:hypothetical protein [Novipirellula sp.]|uniref:hypothetical protein n=1 Tax=Novipirellula sp. TaxID=2795430 RepID=UPI00356B03A7